MIPGTVERCMVNADFQSPERAFLSPERERRGRPDPSLTLRALRIFVLGEHFSATQRRRGRFSDSQCDGVPIPDPARQAQKEHEERPNDALGPACVIYLLAAVA